MFQIPDFRVALKFAPVYRAFQSLLGAQVRRLFVQEYLQPCPGDRVLDVGCGPADVLAYLTDVQYVGVDVSPDYINAARKRFGNRGEFHCCNLSEMGWERLGKFNVAVAFGLLHHLDDDEARNLVAMIARSVSPGGRLVTFDGCFVQQQNWAARRLLAWDRGKHVRNQEDYVALAQGSFERLSIDIRHDLLRVPYTHIIMQCHAPVPHGDDAARNVRPGGRA